MLAAAVDLSVGTLQRYAPEQRLKADATDRLVQLATFYAEGFDLFGKDKFRRWIESHLPALGQPARRFHHHHGGHSGAARHHRPHRIRRIWLMQIFQLARYARRYELSGYGAYLYGGRWSLCGTAMLYTAEGRSLAIMEVLVHRTSEELPLDINLLITEVPDDASQTELTVVDMPPDWRRTGLPQPTVLLGHAWLESGATLALRVPFRGGAPGA